MLRAESEVMPLSAKDKYTSLDHFEEGSTFELAFSEASVRDGVAVGSLEFELPEPDRLALEEYVRA